MSKSHISRLSQPKIRNNNSSNLFQKAENQRKKSSSPTKRPMTAKAQSRQLNPSQLQNNKSIQGLTLQQQFTSDSTVNNQLPPKSAMTVHHSTVTSHAFNHKPQMSALPPTQFLSNKPLGAKKLVTTKKKLDKKCDPVSRYQTL